MYYDCLDDRQPHVYLKAQPMYYRLDAALRTDRLAGEVDGALEEPRAAGPWPRC